MYAPKGTLCNPCPAEIAARVGTMPSRVSAGLLPYRVRADGVVEVYLAHPGGPFWARRQQGAWSVIKGEYDPAHEDPLAAARREYAEELGRPVPPGVPVDLGTFAQSAKTVRVYAIACAGDRDGASPESPSTWRAPATAAAAAAQGISWVSMQWPRGSGRIVEFPEIDRADWHELEAARDLLVAGQRPALDALRRIVGGA